MGIKRKQNVCNQKAEDLDRHAVYNSEDLVTFLLHLQDKMAELTDDEEYDLPIYTEHKRQGYIFRGHPNYRQDGYWRDWALFDWGQEDGDDEEMPGQIWCFVTLNGLEAEDIIFEGNYLENGTYAVIEHGKWDANEEEVTMSDLFRPIQKEGVRFVKGTGKVKKRKFWLADVSSIAYPICVVPDIGANPPCRYFQVRPRPEWVDLFIEWLRDDPNLDQMSESEDEE